MLRSLLPLIVLCLLAPGARSQASAANTANTASSPPRVKLGGSEILLELDRRLKLSAAQQERIMRMKETFQAKHADELRRLRDEVQRVRTALQQARKDKDRLALAKAKEEIDQLREAGEKLRSQFETELLPILTDEQKAKYEKLKKEDKKDSPRRKP
jgi:Spy/CpxP family protein refolding chaperone